ncbi:hypothetical protein DQ010_01830 [Salmonella enterica subsp. enterica serovar Oranienburg]|nr:hypothetical protein [Salmonella enterica subsp. enterica serovar Oranienburg]
MSEMVGLQGLISCKTGLPVVAESESKITQSTILMEVRHKYCKFSLIDYVLSEFCLTKTCYL